MATYENVSWFQRLKNNMKDMTFGEKIAHLWEYYKWFAIVGVLLIVAAVSVVFSVIENSKELVYGGAVVNLTVTDAGNAYLKEGWFEELGSDPKKQKAELDTIFITNLGTGIYSESAAANTTKLTTMIGLQEVDYVLGDLDTIIYLCGQGSFSPLEDVISKELMEQFEGKMFQFEDKGEKYWVAIDITQIPFVQKNVALRDDGEENRVCIAFPGNTGRTERNTEFLQYLLNWSE